MKTKDFEPIMIEPAKNGVIVRKRISQNSVTIKDDLNVFTDIDDLAIFLGELIDAEYVK